MSQRMTQRLKSIIPTILEEGDWDTNKIWQIVNEPNDCDYTYDEITFVIEWIWKQCGMDEQ